MRSNRNLEIGTGFFVLLGFAALAFLTTQLPSSGIKLNGAKSGYFVTAKFDNIGDLKAGSPVSMAGVRIGDVAGIKFDPQDYKAAVTLRIDNQFNQIPDDSDASIQTQGLLGGKYIGIGPGGSEEYLKDGSTIPFTQSAIVLESLVNKFFANMASRGSDSNGGSSGQSSTNQSSSNDGSSGQNDETGGDAGKETQK
jgi:phospholipid/cholesterol/gamma-HCH transport system substrate-binding protein